MRPAAAGAAAATAAATTSTRTSMARGAAGCHGLWQRGRRVCGSRLQSDCVRRSGLRQRRRLKSGGGGGGGGGGGRSSGGSDAGAGGLLARDEAERRQHPRPGACCRCQRQDVHFVVASSRLWCCRPGGGRLTWGRMWGSPGRRTREGGSHWALCATCGCCWKGSRTCRCRLRAGNIVPVSCSWCSAQV